MPNTPLFVKTHDFLLWLIQHTQRFPKNLRHSYTARLESNGFEFQQAILMANAVRGEARAARLLEADGRLTCLRAMLRLAYDLKLLGGRQVEFASERLNELGCLLGAWQKGTGRKPPA
jgi:hypothetical protein